LQESRIEKKKTFRGYKNPRNIIIWDDRNEMFVGHGNGVISVFQLNGSNESPICKPLI